MRRFSHGHGESGTSKSLSFHWLLRLLYYFLPWPEMRARNKSNRGSPAGLGWGRPARAQGGPDPLQCYNLGKTEGFLRSDPLHKVLQGVTNRCTTGYLCGLPGAARSWNPVSVAVAAFVSEASRATRNGARKSGGWSIAALSGARHYRTGAGARKSAAFFRNAVTGSRCSRVGMVRGSRIRDLRFQSSGRAGRGGPGSAEKTKTLQSLRVAAVLTL